MVRLEEDRGFREGKKKRQASKWPSTLIVGKSGVGNEAWGTNLFATQKDLRGVSQRGRNNGKRRIGDEHGAFGV